VFNALYQMLDDQEVDVPAKNEVLDRIYDFIYQKSDVERVVKWLDGPTYQGVEIQKMHRQAILIAVCKTKEYDHQYKIQMMQKVLGDDMSDLTI
jgi:hypothetical protein